MIESKFDKPFELRFYETFYLNDILRLTQPYLPKDLGISCETQKELVEKYLHGLISVLTEDEKQIILPQKIAVLYRAENKGGKVYETIVKRGLDNRLRKLPKRSYSKEYKQEIINNGYSWEVVAECKSDYDYFTVEVSDEIKDKITIAGKEKKDFVRLWI
jgi:hypothetical protein